MTPPLAFPSFPSFLAGMRRRSILMSCAGVDARFGGETPLPGPSPWTLEWALGDSNPRPQPCESVNTYFTRRRDTTTDRFDQD